MIKDRTGQRFGNLTALYLTDKRSSQGKCIWHCICDCGNETDVVISNLVSGNTKSCGCQGSRHKIGKDSIKHGISDRHPLYYTWTSFKARCECPGRPEFERYGARGITVCDEWRYDFKAFYDWAMENGWAYKGPRGTPGALSLDRIDNDGPYAPWNCRWVTIEEQSRNRRSNIHIAYKGQD